FATNNSENVSGLIAVAVPICDDGGRVVAGLALHAPDARMDVKEAEQRLPTMRAAATKLQKYIVESQDMDGEQPGFMDDAGGDHRSDPS
ncbi:MAG: IclR family transcriptional regulator C-terminal domain-containing protein, partial [Rhodospirillales bacterium]|nr:IclR family transcriptional regulator C-terminal domain-containing protein [Rhodospirillales bacterium]